MSNAKEVRALKDKAHELRAGGKFKAAIQEYARAAKLAPADADIHHKLGELYARIGDNDHAIAAYEKVAGHYAAEGFLLKAIAICKLILAIDPSHTETLEALANCYAKQEEVKKRKLPASMSGAISHPYLDNAAPAAPAAPMAAVSTEPPDPGRLDGKTVEPALHVDEDLDLSLFMMEGHAAHVGTEIAMDEDDAAIVIEIEEDEVEPAMVDITRFAHKPLFSDLSPEDFCAVAASLEMRHVTPKTRLLTEGVPGDSMFIVVQGKVSVFREHRGGARDVMAELGPGSFFGEMALIGRAPRLTCVEALEETLLLVLPREEIRSLAEQSPSVARVSLEFYKSRLLENLMAASPIFRAFGDKDHKAIIEGFQSASVGPGVPIVNKGQEGTGLFVILRGHCEVLDTKDDGQMVKLAELREGDVFGEISLIRKQPAMATVRATHESTILRLDPEVFQKHVLAHPEVERALLEMSEEKLARTHATMLASGAL